MNQSPLLLFPVAEFEARLKKIAACMERDGFDALILTSDENTYYFSCFRSIVWDSKVSTPATLVITKDGEIALATSSTGRFTARATSCVDDIRPYGKDKDCYPSYVEAIVSRLAEKKLTKGRIGFEFGDGHKMHLNYAMTQALFAALPDAERADAADILWEVRSVKSPLEIEKLRKSCDINIKAIQKGFDNLKEGMTEMDLYGLIMAEYFASGAERALPIGLRAGKDRYSQGNCPPSYRPIMRGDVILVDGGPIYHGYYSDIIREAVIGKPTTEQQEMFDVAREACHRGIEAVKPGVPICEVCKTVDAFMDASKFAEINVYKNWCGHSIGTGVHEYPMLDTATTRLLEPGMVFAIEPYFYKENVGSLGIEENILVTETGCEILTPSRSELMVL